MPRNCDGRYDRPMSLRVMLIHLKHPQADGDFLSHCPMSVITLRELAAFFCKLPMKHKHLLPRTTVSRRPAARSQRHSN